MSRPSPNPKIFLTLLFLWTSRSCILRGFIPRPDDYRAHTSCISEAERYEKTVYRGNRKGESQKGKKMTPQEAWNHVLVTAAESAPQSIRHNVEQLSCMDNVPRKEKQFRNFAVNSLRLRGRDANRVVDAVWSHLAKVREEEQKRREGGQQTKGDQSGNGSKEREGARSGDSHDKVQCIVIEPTEQAQGGEGDKADAKGSCDNNQVEGTQSNGGSKEVCPKLVKKTMKKLLKKAPNRTMKVKELRQEVKTRLMLKGLEKELKKVVAQQINVSRKKIKVDGKLVTLLG
uniref:Zinc finger C2H2 LYAR-type domain-containing protein n=1 Tax=Odontella aurita TaxID=265563 RepID=A0A7S4HW90_9STRA|mmetsp:Transcript_16080/g.46305  ORF Transcript_16080/g.46305 Transcript_16080/m.46305 type:complete len:287 (+) Transcript_16080:333-1193(+)